MPSTSGEDTIPTVITGPVHVEMKDREPTEDDWENMPIFSLIFNC